jgi:hypothetical protein
MANIRQSVLSRGFGGVSSPIIINSPMPSTPAK